MQEEEQVALDKGPPPSHHMTADKGDDEADVQAIDDLQDDPSVHPLACCLSIFFPCAWLCSW